MRNKDGKVYLLCPYGLGDTLLVCGYKNAIEKKYKAKVMLIIKRSHVAVMRIYGIVDYIVYDFSHPEIRAIESRTIRGEICQGEIYLARPEYDEKNSLFKNFMERQLSFREMYSQALGLDENAEFCMPTQYPEVTKTLTDKLPGSIDEVTLLLPEMNAPDIDKVPLGFFEKIVLETSKPIVVNMVKPMGILSEYCIDLTIEELIALSLNCRKVISARSGFCDLIYNRANDLEVIYPNNIFYELYKFESIFLKKNPYVIERTLSFGTAIKKMDCKTVAIYGMGFVGKRIAECFKLENIKVEFVIDKRNDIDGVGAPVYHPEGNIPKVDLIIVTPEKDAKEIIHILELKMEHAKILFYKDLQFY